ncbi:hypothetical protein [[Limnothrix rosea] IAM M-220]|uniref:hypothetical protein n=1 Tax=[Limnothrix rosea] IAM M-220 TaxID=454133 RepID=UPI00095F909E|nr:hypothetical protein [[Limnothrix rosea] IAM M-220]OKH19213.1 hypothetical protein NIES208_02885 [[Limnothrix rosea] IAM M-220]
MLWFTLGICLKVLFLQFYFYSFILTVFSSQAIFNGDIDAWKLVFEPEFGLRKVRNDDAAKGRVSETHDCIAAGFKDGFDDSLGRFTIVDIGLVFFFSLWLLVTLEAR